MREVYAVADHLIVHDVQNVLVDKKVKDPKGSGNYWH